MSFLCRFHTFVSEKCCQIIKVCAILWNFVLEQEGEDTELVLEGDPETAAAAAAAGSAAVPAPGDDRYARGLALRERVARDFLAASAQDN